MKLKIFMILLTTTILFGCTKSTQKEGLPTNEVLKIGMTQEFDSLNPMIMQMSASNYIYSMFGRGLMVLDDKGKWIPQTTKSIPTLENGEAELFTEKGVKKIRAHWELKENAKWGDGQPVTAYDVKLSWEIAKLPTVSVAGKETYSQIEKVIIDKKNPKKFTFIYGKAKWDFYQMGDYAILPSHLEKEIVQKYGNQPEGYDKNSNYTKNLTNPGLFNGPYKIQEIKLGSHVVLVPNPYFYGPPPKIKKIITKLIPNTGTLEANLRTKTIDLISTLGMSLDQALVFEKKVKKQNLPYNVDIKSSLIYEHIDLNLQNEILKNINVRKALVYGIDRDKLTQALFEGRQKKAIHNIAPIDPWYVDDPKKIVFYPPSKRKAQKLLEKSGWQLKEDGYRYKNGKKLSLTLMTTAGAKLRETVQVYLQKEWKDIGVEIKIKNEPARVYFGETVRKGKYTGMAMYAWLSSPENNPKDTMHTKSIPTKENSYSGQNSGKWSNKKVDTLLDKLEVEFNAQKRKDLIAKILYHYTNDVPVIPLYYRADISVSPKSIKGYALTGNEFRATNFIENWTLE